MKKIIAATFLIITAYTHNSLCMENKPNILEKITVVKNPLYARYITKDKVIIGGLDECSIVNLTTKKSKKISDLPYDDLAVRSDGKKIAIIEGLIAQIYDVEKETFEWIKIANHPINSCAFGPLDGTILLHEGPTIKEYNYVKNTSKKLITEFGCFACDPIRQKLCIASNGLLFNNKAAPLIYDLNKPCLYNCDNGTTFERIPLNEVIDDDNEMTNPYRFCTYSPNGSYIAIGDNQLIVLFNTQSNQCSRLAQKENEHLRCIAFHPNSLILAILSMPRGHRSQHAIIRYWDIVTSSVVNEIKFLNSIGRDVSFSPNGIEVMFTLENTKEKCIICSVPFEAIYQSDTKQKFPNLLLLLCQLGEQKEVPHDITRYISDILFTTFKR